MSVHVVLRTFGRFGHGRAQAVHVVPPVTVVTEQQLVLEGEIPKVISSNPKNTDLYQQE